MHTESVERSQLSEQQFRGVLEWIVLDKPHAAGLIYKTD